jgi:Na+-translocating ferredoxin:NAD+ oxidoreductase subunit E
MKLEGVRKYRKRLNLTSGILKENPVLTLGMALPFAVVASTTLQRGVFMSIVMLVSIVSGFVVSRVTGKRLHPVFRVTLCCTVTLCALTIVLMVMGNFALLRKELGVYVPLAAINSISVSLLDPKKDVSFLSALRQSFCMWAGFALVMCVLSAIREVMSLHTIWDIPLDIGVVAISGAELPCFGFILLGFLAAFGRKLDRLRIRMLLRAGDTPDTGKEESV